VRLYTCNYWLDGALTVSACYCKQHLTLIAVTFSPLVRRRSVMPAVVQFVPSQRPQYAFCAPLYCLRFSILHYLLLPRVVAQRPAVALNPFNSGADISSTPRVYRVKPAHARREPLLPHPHLPTSGFAHLADGERSARIWADFSSRGLLLHFVMHRCGALWPVHLRGSFNVYRALVGVYRAFFTNGGAYVCSCVYGCDDVQMTLLENSIRVRLAGGVAASRTHCGYVLATVGWPSVSNCPSPALPDYPAFSAYAAATHARCQHGSVGASSALPIALNVARLLWASPAPAVGRHAAALSWSRLQQHQRIYSRWVADRRNQW